MGRIVRNGAALKQMAMDIKKGLYSELYCEKRRNYACCLFITNLSDSKWLSADSDSQMAGYMQSIAQKNMDACCNQLNLCFSGIVHFARVLSADRAGQEDYEIDQQLLAGYPVVSVFGGFDGGFDLFDAFPYDETEIKMPDCCGIWRNMGSGCSCA